MIDVKLIVEDTEAVRKALSKRMSPDNLNLESIISSYEEVKKLKTEFEALRAKQNSYNDKMAQVQKGSEEFMKLVAELKDIAAQVKEKEQVLKEKEEELKSKVEVLPNIPDDDVPAGEKESNTVVAEFGEKIQFNFKPKDHVAIAEDLGLVDFERAAKMAGAQFSMYVGDGARLEWALINFFIEQHIKDGYTMIMPPHLLLEESAYTAGQLPKFREDVYWVQDGNCLLPTAETALANIYRNEILDEKDLPKKLFAYTPCY
jgi:seryl-tRNA synthetase